LTNRFEKTLLHQSPCNALSLRPPLFKEGIVPIEACL